MHDPLRDDVPETVLGAHGRWRLLAYFAVISFAAFALVGVTVHELITREVSRTNFRAATDHAVFVADAFLRDRLTPDDIAKPVTGDRYDALRTYVSSRLIVGGVIRVKVWSANGTVVFSDEPRLVGRRFPTEAASLADVLRKGPETEITDLTEAENVFERGLAKESISTYVPVALGRSTTPIAIVELYQDYTPLLKDAARSQHELDLLLLGALLLLYAFVLPLAHRTGGTMQRQAVRLTTLLSRERETVRRLEEYDRLKDELITAASHELRTPLTVVRGIVTMLKDRDDLSVETSRDLINRLDANAEKLERLLVNILDLERIQQNTLEARPELLDLVPVIENAATSVDLKDHTLSFDVRSVKAEIDRVLVERMIANLVANAVRHTPDGTPIVVRLRSDADTISLHVEDEGPGVPDALKEDIFDAFTRGGDDRHGPGTGIGLTIVAQFARMHGGRAWVEDRPGGGAIFRVDIPLVRSPTKRKRMRGRDAANVA